MAEDRRADRAGDKADRVDCEGFERADQRIGSREVELCEDQPGDRAVQKKSYHSIVVPIVLAITAHRNCTQCSNSESGPAAIPTAVIEASPPDIYKNCCRTWQTSRRSLLFYYCEGPVSQVMYGDLCPGGETIRNDPARAFHRTASLSRAVPQP
jgi:hypothetical protein